VRSQTVPQQSFRPFQRPSSDAGTAMRDLKAKTARSAIPDLRLAVCLLFLLALSSPVLAESLDVVLLLDDSGSMRTNDPERRLEQGVNNFLLRQQSDTRVAIIAFAADPEVLVPLTHVDRRTLPRLQGTLASLDYDGRWTDTAAAVERALYELRYNGRPDALKAVVLMTDGVIDTGSPGLDQERTSWLRGALMQDAAAEGVQIYGLAFSEQADFQLLYALARGTGAEYFRADDASGLHRALESIDLALTRAARSTTAIATETAQVTTPQRSTAAPAAVQTQPLAQQELLTAEPLVDDSATTPATESGAAVGPGSSSTGEVDKRIVGVAVVLVLSLAWFTWLYLKQTGRTRLLRRVSGSAAGDVTTRGVIYDVSDDADVKRYELGKKVTIIGRVAGTETGRQYIVVRERTVGRHHASMERRGDVYWITDENSVNGTFVNDRRIYGAHPLKHGDNIRVHKHKFMFVIPSLIGSDRTLMEHDRIVDQAAS
jgi:Mg-chelatase subunit ChlD